MKRHEFLVSSNGWEYASAMTISCESVSFEWASEEDEAYSKKWRPGEQEDGNVIIADGIRIQLDEPFTYNGHTKEPKR